MIQNPKKSLIWYLRAYVNFQVCAIILIILLLIADFFALMSIFSPENTDIPIQSSILYCLILASCLEGLPSFLGVFLSILKDEARYKINDKTVAEWGFKISFIGSVVAFAVVCFLRIMLIYENGGLNGFLEKNYQGVFYIDVFLMICPFLTSLLAFVISWLAFKADSEKTLEAKIELLNMQYINSQSEFLNDLNKLHNARAALWTTLTDHKPMPKVLDIFRKESFARIRSKLIENCIITYPMQIERYNAAVESILELCILEMSHYTTIPLVISSMNVKELLKKFDESQNKDNEAWDYERAKNDLETELKKILDNAVVVAQVKTTTVPYPLEGEEEL